MASNLTIESPNFEKINKEAGQFTSDAVATLWAALNDTRAALRRDFRYAAEKITSKVLELSPSASVDNLDSQGSSVISFTGGTQNFTGVRAPETGEVRLLAVHNNGSGTITVKHNVTSEAANRFILDGAADKALAQNQGILFVYLASNWREVARSG
jgi:hypothetical protein